MNIIIIVCLNMNDIVLAYLMLFAALTNSVCLNNASLFLYIFMTGL